jgi:MYXO-CTERM domain-containing protein
MRGPSWSVIAAMGLFTAPALAAVTEPNGLVVPRDSNNGETQIHQLFAQRGEQINWIDHALELPETFSPLCDFVVSLVLRGSSSRLPFGWYNVPPPGASAPTPAQINELIPCDAAVGAAITSQSIKSHPNYTGGLVGFALASGGGCLRFDNPQGIEQIHFSEKRFNVKYQNDANRPWVMSLKYNSTLEPNAFYLAFEDYRVTPDGWENDGDFNDYVVFMTGLACPGGGVACDTGMPGACGPGVLQCDVGRLICTGIVSGADKEQCDAVDNDCNGIIDEGDLCTDNKVCHGGKCVPRCGAGEFSCSPPTVCDSASGLCLDPSCVGKTCPEGEICVAGNCRAPCGEIECPPPQVCLLGACVDPCLGKTCPDRQVCDKGMCRPVCTCTPCPSGAECNEMTGLCAEPGCGGTKTCASGTYCAAGRCVDACSAAVCPPRQRCASGACVPADDAGSSGGSAGIGIGAGPGIPGSGGSSNGGGDAGPGSGGSGTAASKPKPSDPGCACTSASAPASLSGLALLGLVGWILRRRTNSGQGC